MSIGSTDLFRIFMINDLAVTIKQPFFSETGNWREKPLLPNLQSLPLTNGQETKHSVKYNTPEQAASYLGAALLNNFRSYNNMNNRQTGSAKLTKLMVLVAICGVMVFAVMMLPKGFKDDLTLIGKGTVAVVLTHDKDLVGGTTTMALLNDVRSDYEGSVEFLAVDIATPVGQAFMREQRVRPIELVAFGPEGSRLQVLKAGITEQELRTALDALIGQ